LSKAVNVTIIEYSVTATAKPNDATVTLLAEGFNQSFDNHQQSSIFSSNIDTYYVVRYDGLQNNVIQAFGRYPNYNYLTFDLDGSDSVNQPVLDRLAS
jgi:hypothetical protein